MPFPWMHVVRAPSRGRAEMYRREIEERAALLFRLGYGKAHTRARLVANVAWEFEVGGAPAPTTKEIDAAVEAVYRRGGTRSGTPTV